jgi:carbonic anhydrase
MHQGKLSLNAWIYRIESGEVLAYDSVLHDFVAPSSRLAAPEHEYNLHANYLLHHPANNNGQSSQLDEASHLPGYTHLSPEQSHRIYRGSH